MSNEQPLALLLADAMDAVSVNNADSLLAAMSARSAASELRRQHAEIERLHEERFREAAEQQLEIERLRTEVERLKEAADGALLEDRDHLLAQVTQLQAELAEALEWRDAAQEELRKCQQDAIGLQNELAALQAQEPVAWLYRSISGAQKLHTEKTPMLNVDIEAAIEFPHAHSCVPLYTAPAAPIAQPLTNGQIVGIAIGAWVDAEDDDDDGQTVFAIARAVEAACAKAWGVRLEGDAI